jgi:hypothetical protein
LKPWAYAWSCQGDNGLDGDVANNVAFQYQLSVAVAVPKSCQVELYTVL